METLHFGIIGCGAIGSEIAKAIDRGIIPGELVAICDLDKKKAKNLVSQLKSKPKIVNLDNLVKMADFVIESAHPNVVQKISDKVFPAKKSLLIMSIGGLLQHPEILDKARKKCINLYLPSGAVAGIDALKAGKMGKIYSVTLITSKPPAGLKGAPYLVNEVITSKKIDLSKLKRKICVFEGNALQAIKGFPANINVAGILSLAGIGAKNTKVKIFADPKLKRNVHEMVIQGNFGRITTRAENLPSPVNPKTSQLAILSAIATLKQVTDSVRIGI